MLRMLVGSCFMLLFTAAHAFAHFGMVIPSESTVEDKEKAAVSLEFSFSHPMEMVGMTLEKPARAQVFMDGKAEDLSASLKPAKIMEHDAWKAEYTVKKPGVYQVVMEPTPYWEPAEDCFIVHYTKTYIAAFGEEEGWDEPAGVKTEIVPLTRPFGNYAGNVFSGRVLVDGKPAPGVLVEVEYYNRDKKYKAPNDYMVTQSVMTDENGVFVYGVPFAGWWGFAALSASDLKMKHEGADKDVELGAVLWTEFIAPQR
ncbi:DUF4198 domain-containing protein [Desulfovibrio sp. OttesenSCG-928-G15]|nr:DUF4198 domain-containing protein [Desulfovibrio sp. OttesenSCG-928-G15]